MHYIKFTVRGEKMIGGRIHSFPLDMLRYDSCFPATPEDVSWMISALNDRTEPVELMLGTIGIRAFKGWKQGDPIPSTSICPVTIERWHSFGWEVTEIYPSKKI